MGYCCTPSPYLPRFGPWIGIAFRYATPRAPRDRVVSILTGGPYVHTEIMLADGRGGVRAYAASDNTSGFSPSNNFNAHASTNTGSRWTAFRYPLSSEHAYKKVYALILQIIALSLPYNTRDLWQCCIQVALPYEKDLDCEDPSTWQANGVFCSQVALLILRRLRREGLVAFPPDLDAEIGDMIEHTNSRGCSPNQLYRMLATVPHPEKKGVKAREAPAGIQHSHLPAK